MNVNERRALLQLHPLVSEPEVLVWFDSKTSFQRMPIPCRIATIDAEAMLAVLETIHVPGRAEIPLTFVRVCWKSSTGWNVAIDGSAFDGAGDKRTGFRPPGGAFR